jgi:uncharacterized protein YbjT (DUF2867 family)
MRVFVTGATGFVGPAVANAIADAGHELRVLERKPGAWSEAGIRCQAAVQGDVTDSEAMRRAVQDIDVVVHLVAIRQGKPKEFERVMVGGTRNLLAAAKDAGVRRFVLMSALGVTEQTKDLVPYYGAKWTEEQDTKASGLEHVIFRPSFIFGRDGGILPTFKKLGGPDVVSWNEFWQRLRAQLGIRRRPTMHLPTGLMKIPAALTERLPGNIPLTRDLLEMLESGDNVVSNDDAVRTFDLPLVPLDEQLRRAA